MSVAVCHILIVVLSNDVVVPGADQRTKSRLGRKVTLVCVTDFCCWLPFLICCALHTAEVVDMSPWYQVFSLNILPINSVLNPLLYSDILTKVLNILKPAISRMLTATKFWESIRSIFCGVPVLPEPAGEVNDERSHPGTSTCAADHVAVKESVEQCEATTSNSLQMNMKYPSCNDIIPNREIIIEETAFNLEITTTRFDQTSKRRNSIT